MGAIPSTAGSVGVGDLFGGIDGTHEWWLDNRVPGGTVKQTLKSSKSDEDRWDMELAAYGSDAKSELGSK